MEEQDVVNQYLVLNNELNDHLDLLDNSMDKLDTLDQINQTLSETPSIESINLLTIAIKPLYQDLGLESFEEVSKESISGIIKAGADKVNDVIQYIINKFKQLWAWVKEQWRKLFQKKIDKQIKEAEENKENIQSITVTPNQSTNEPIQGNGLTKTNLEEKSRHAAKIFMCSEKTVIDINYIRKKGVLLENFIHYFIVESGELDPMRLKEINMDKFTLENYPCGFEFIKDKGNYTFTKVPANRLIKNEIVSPSNVEQIKELDTIATRLWIKVSDIDHISNQIEKNYHQYFNLLKISNPDSLGKKITNKDKKAYISKIKESYRLLQSILNVVIELDKGILVFNELSISN